MAERRQAAAIEDAWADEPSSSASGGAPSSGSSTTGAHTRWEDLKERHPQPSPAERARLEQDAALAQLVHDLRIGTGLSQGELAARVGTTSSVVARLEEGGGAGNRLDTLARIAVALGRHLVLSMPEAIPGPSDGAVVVGCDDARPTDAELRAEVAALNADEADRKEVTDIAKLMEVLRRNPPDPEWARELAELRAFLVSEDRWADDEGGDDGGGGNAVGPSGDG